MRHVSISAKILSILVAFGLFALSVAGYAAYGMVQVNTEHTALETHDVRTALMVARSNRALQAVRANIASLLISTTDEGNKLAMGDLAQSREDFFAFLDQAAAASSDRASAIDDFKDRARQMLDGACAKAVGLGAAATESATILVSQKVFNDACSPGFRPFTMELTAMVATAAERVASRSKQLSEQVQHQVWTTVGAMLLGLVVVMVAGLVAVRAWVVTPIRSLSAVMKRLANGDYEVAVVGADRRDELGGMAAAVQVFKQSGLDKLSLAAETARQQQELDAERSEAERVRAESAANQARAVEVIGSGLAKLAAGDLACRIDERLATASDEKLRNDFNAALDELHSTIQHVASNALTIGGGASEISQAADDLSRRTEQQAASLEETAAALDEITATVSKTASGATNALATAAMAKAEAEKSGEIVSGAVAAMGQIENSAREIGQIIGVIDEIAFQTNLLALNAGVEAARAGDAGRGFAVVASEVRALAQRSAQAAKEIKALIQASNTQVKSGVGLVGETGEALGRIGKHVAQVHDAIVDIATSAQEQATGLHQVNTAVNQMDQVTQQNAAMVEQSTAASHALAGETSELLALTKRFRLREAAAAAPDAAPSRGAHPKAAAPKAATLKAPTPEAAAKRKPVAASLHKAAPRANAALAKEDWEEF